MPLILIFHCGILSYMSYISKPLPGMAEIEHPEQYSWWLNELESLGVNTLEKHGLNHHKEASDLTEAVKQTLYEDYLQAYSESNR
jgi:hypothetical protein